MNYSSQILRGNTETIILATLMEKDSYGYEIMKTIQKRGEGLIDIKDATIYTALKRMEKDTWIESYWGNEEDVARRKYYTITPAGREIYAQKVAEWKEITIIMERLIGGGLSWKKN